jgi:mRNA-degrading endonuclease RelE of RelBE toxin-antitoxin system
MAASRFVEVTDKEIKINSVPKKTKDLCKNTKTIIRPRLGDYRIIGNMHGKEIAISMKIGFSYYFEKNVH